MNDQGTFGFQSKFETSPERLKEFEVDCTPGPVVRQGLERLRDDAKDMPKRLRILDLCAGSGVFGQQARKVFHIEELVAVEIREEEADNLARHYDEVHVGDFREIVPQLGSFDLVVTNPAFSLFVPALRLGIKALGSMGGVVMLLGLNELGTRGGDSRAAWDEHLPSWQLRIAGTLGFRGPGINPKTGKPWGADVRSYSWWCWDCLDREEPGWMALDLPLLAAHARSWRVRPGREGE